jgi:hypothetical protein
LRGHNIVTSQVVPGGPLGHRSSQRAGSAGKDCATAQAAS